MIFRRLVLLALGVGCFLLIHGPAHASDSSVRFVVTQSTVQIEGSSTIHDWVCEGSDVRGYLEFATDYETIQNTIRTLNQLVLEGSEITSATKLPLTRPPVVYINVPIRRMDCGREAMNEDMYEALKANEFPTIHYRFYRLVDSVRKLPGGDYRLVANGGLALAGEGQTVDISITATRIRPGEYRIRGKKKLRMTDFGIKPPSAFFGLIKAYDKITIRFDITVNKNAKLQNPLEFPEIKLTRDIR